MNISKYIDHTLLKATAMPNDIETLCEEAVKYDFFSVCINSGYVSLSKKLLTNTDIKVCSVVGFPLGAMSMRSKIYETEQALSDGANEIDMVLNVGILKSGGYKEVLQEISFLKKACGKNVLKVILETCYLTDEEKRLACQISVDAGADFVKTSTGFGTGGATVEDVLLMKEAVNGKAKIKASGGVRDFETAKKYIDLGVSRIGTSNGIAIVSGGKGDGY